MSASRLLHEFPLHYEAIVGFLRGHLGNADEAREVAHETWVRLAENPPDDIGPIDNPHGYCCTVAVNVHRDRQRRVRWLREHLAVGLATAASVSHAPDVADGLMYRQALAALDTALAALPKRAREAFEAHRIHGESQADVAARLGVALNTVERDLIAAQDRIAAALHHWRGDKTTHGAVRMPKGRRERLASLLGLGALGVLGAGGGWFAWRTVQDLRTRALQWQAAFSTPHGQRVDQTLPDGSMLTLDAQSRADVAFDARHRGVRLLEGAAFFAVRSDAGRPFVVDAGPVTVTVLGTRFAVEIEPAGTVLVQVESGRVRVERDGRLLADALTAGQGLRVPVGDGAAQSAGGSAAPWREGRLHFDATLLGEAMQRLARYSSQDLRVDERAALLRVSGNVEIAHAQDWLQALPAALPVRVQRPPGGGVLIVRR